MDVCDLLVVVCCGGEGGSFGLILPNKFAEQGCKSDVVVPFADEWCVNMVGLPLQPYVLH
jgi:hypothetical protein